MENLGWKSLDVIAYMLLMIGAVSWGWIAFFGFDPVAMIFGNMTKASKFVYSLFAMAAFYDMLSMPFIFRRWDIHLDNRLAR
ncbi:MAG: DUF378 domain-containing protein [Planctomycetota bacterium]|jgi:uncharacterized membrane protein YuzA (DUF378 family)